MGRRRWLPAVLRWLVVAAAFALLEVLTRGGVIPDLIFPPPTEVVRAAVDQIPTGQFAADLARTAETVAVAYAAGLIGGAVFGTVSWRVPVLGRVFEPYLVALYAMPTIVFYPLLLALLGLGFGPIAVIAAVMALIPVTVNVTVALRSVAPTLPRLGRSLNCSRRQMYRHILLPAALPLAMPGLRLGFIYALIGTIAMEFILADRGLGFRIGIDYRQFEGEQMWGLVVIVAFLAIVANALLSWLERRVRRDML
ncbi:MAG: ABC transporter permease [Streptosporangiaceae bacterium]